MIKTFLGIDYGTVRVGVAIAKAPIAEPLTILKSNQAVGAIKRFCQEYDITDIVIGVSEGEMADISKQFANQVQKEVSLPIHFQNETLSSYEIHEQMLRSNVKKSKAKQPIDHFAAAAILQDFLDENQPFN